MKLLTNMVEPKAAAKNVNKNSFDDEVEEQNSFEREQEEEKKC